MKENDLSFLIRGAIFNVFNRLGPGLLESVYEYALVFELKKLGLFVQTQVPLPVTYDDVHLDKGYRVDIIVNGLVVVEIKSTERLEEVHHMQLLTYLKLSGLKLGLLVNFNTSNISKSIYRKVNNL
ncbi:MAG: GxxExxY protein [Chitinophagaceae bacterium]|nr:MAG: GxxExxY protein [Chitinophagaceae bacterium]